MGLLDGTNQATYYNAANAANYGNYQFMLLCIFMLEKEKLSLK